MMAHDPYELMISLALDDELPEEERLDLVRQIHGDEDLTDLFGRMTLVDKAFSGAAEVAPPPNFTAGVMARIELYERRRQWYPWVITVLTIASVMAAISIAAPIVLFSLGIDGIVANWPLFGRALGLIAQALSAVLGVIAFSIGALGDWLTYLTSDPVALGAVLTALALASTWIGILESMKITSAIPQQQAS